MHSQAPNIIGESPQLAAALDHISRLAAIDRSVLIIGERGTGKELAAERLHYLSVRPGWITSIGMSSWRLVAND